MNFANSNIRISWSLPPGEPLQPRWSPAAPKDFEDTLRCSLETLSLLLLQFPTTDKSLWVTTCIVVHTFIPSCPCYYKIPRITLCCPENPLSLLPLQFFATWIPLRIITRACRVSVHPQLFMCFTNFFGMLFDLPKILSSLLLLFILTCLHYGYFHMSSNVH